MLVERVDIFDSLAGKNSDLEAEIGPAREFWAREWSQSVRENFVEFELMRSLTIKEVEDFAVLLPILIPTATQLCQ